jgi:hypothetical protein
MVAENPSNALSVPDRDKPRRIVAATRREETMKPLRSSRQLIKMWHRREKVTVEHVARTVGDEKSTPATTHSAFTASGLTVEEQVRKACHRSPFGLAIF